MTIEFNSDNNTNNTAGHCPAPRSFTVPVDLHIEENRAAEKQKRIIYGAMLTRLDRFIGTAQIQAMREVLASAESRYMQSKIAVLTDIIETMPKTYETDGQADPMVNLHYFVGGCDWYITEGDCEVEQLQAFGKADLGCGFPELGYISIVDILQAGAELDLHWSVCKVSEV